METSLSINNGVNNVNNYRNMKDIEVSHGIKVKHYLKRSNFWWVYNTITSTVKKKAVEEIRSKQTKEERKVLKESNLDYFNIGIFQDDYLNKENFISSEFMIFDFDDLDNPEETKNKLRSNHYVFAVFISPSGNGLKIVFRLMEAISDEKYFSQVYKYYANKLGANLGEDPDHTSDCSRLCFFSYDPEMYVNEYALPLPVNGLEDFTLQNHDKVNREDLLKKFQPAKEGERHIFLVSNIGTMIKKGFDRDFTEITALRLNLSNSPPLPEYEVIETVEYMYRQYAEEDIISDFWSQGKEIFQIGFVGNTFFIEKISKGKFNIIVSDRIVKRKYRNIDLNDKKVQEKLKQEIEKEFCRLVINKHIKHLARVDYIGDPSIQDHFYSVKLDGGIIEVRYAMLPSVIKDNQFVENYLEGLFGKYKEFIKQYLAVYCYSNYKKLPTLILYGRRGGGKSNFAEILMEIFLPLSMEWHGNEQSFTYEGEQKLLLVEENNQDKASQYKTLKKYTGQKYALVHKKFKDPYRVMNNMNIILLSNEPVPLYVKKEELPTDEANNQFFVYECKMLQHIDNSVQDAVIKRLGNYIRTELKPIYNKLNMESFRYSISVPITQEEKNLFNVNTTELDHDTDLIIQKISKRIASESRLIEIKKNDENNIVYLPFIEKRLLPVSLITSSNGEYTRSHKNTIIKNLKKLKLIEAEDSNKVQVNGRREYCYKISEDFYIKLTSEFELI